MGHLTSKSLMAGSLRYSLECSKRRVWTHTHTHSSTPSFHYIPRCISDSQLSVPLCSARKCRTFYSHSCPESFLLHKHLLLRCVLGCTGQMWQSYVQELYLHHCVDVRSLFSDEGCGRKFMLCECD